MHNMLNNFDSKPCNIQHTLANIQEMPPPYLVSQPSVSDVNKAAETVAVAGNLPQVVACYPTPQQGHPAQVAVAYNPQSYPQVSH